MGEQPRRSPRPVPDALQALRHSTRELHRQVDQSMPLATDDAGVAEYACHLRLIADWLEAIESPMAPYIDGPQDPARLAPLRRLPKLHADLQALGDAHARPAARPVPGEAFVDAGSTLTSTFAEPAYRWGVSYVIEGAQLGAMFLRRRFHGVLPQAAIRYFHASGEDAATTERWLTFVAAMDDALVDQAAIDRACAGAQAAFERLITLIQRRRGARLCRACAETSE